MRGYTETRSVPIWLVEMFRRAERIVAALPDDPQGAADDVLLRCHEVTRVVRAHLACQVPQHDRSDWRMTVVDGAYGAADHSWIEITSRAYRQHYLLDCYAVGQLPMVHLLDLGTVGLLHGRLYQARCPRNDIRQPVIDCLLAHLATIDERQGEPT